MSKKEKLESNPLAVFYEEYESQEDELSAFERSQIIALNKVALDRCIKKIITSHHIASKLSTQ